jgi:signal transduction histidine kinase
MNQALAGQLPVLSHVHLLLAYIANLELEVDRLRKQGQYVRLEVLATLARIKQSSVECGSAGDGPSVSPDVGKAIDELMAILADLDDPTGFHPVRDHVGVIEVRPLVAQVFRWQQRLLDALGAELRLDSDCDQVEWFPVRMRNILDNLVSNALKYRDPDKAVAWVHVSLRTRPDTYELKVQDNGVGLPDDQRAALLDGSFRVAKPRELAVGLPVVKLLIQQSGGALTADSGEGQGTTFVAVLPRYEVDDYLT